MARSEEKRQRRLYRLAVQLPPTAQQLSETQKFPKQSPIRLVPLVYDHPAVTDRDRCMGDGFTIIISRIVWGSRAPTPLSPSPLPSLDLSL